MRCLKAILLNFVYNLPSLKYKYYFSQKNKLNPVYNLVGLKNKCKGPLIVFDDNITDKNRFNTIKIKIREHPKKHALKAKNIVAGAALLACP
jgi:hypothetical protein